MTLRSSQVAVVMMLPLALLLASCSDRSGRSEAAEEARQQRFVRETGVPTTREETGSDGGEAKNLEELAPVVAPRPENDPDDVHRASIVGVWKQNNTGIRWLRVRPDGTATMFIDPDWVAKAVIGSGLTIEIEWSVEDGHVMMRSLSGEPSTAFKAVTTLYGSDRNRKIAELSEKSFVMLDEEDGEESAWERVADEGKAPKQLR